MGKRISGLFHTFKVWQGVHKSVGQREKGKTLALRRASKRATKRKK